MANRPVGAGILGTSLSGQSTIKVGDTVFPGATRTYNTWQWLGYALGTWGPGQWDQLVAGSARTAELTSY